MENKNDVFDELSEWLYFDEMLQRWGISYIALIKYITDYHLPAYYHDKPEPLHELLQDEPYNDLYYLSEDRIKKLGFKLSDIKDFENKYPQLLEESTPVPDIVSTTTADILPEEPQGKIFFCGPETKWKDIKITLVADDMVRVKTPKGENRCTYHELGMSDKRIGDKPTMLWELLKLFAKNDGFISSMNPKYDRCLPDTAKRLNAHLKKLFGINESIYQGHYKKMKGYRTKIKFSDQTIVAD
ncbi:MAG: hypothetical protein HQ551_07715 [Desulfobacteraceae bacterium]|nr:hypothetical protein [Desulfobacteraceae bacterium]